MHISLNMKSKNGKKVFARLQQLRKCHGRLNSNEIINRKEMLQETEPLIRCTQNVSS